MVSFKAKITGIKYTPLLCQELTSYNLSAIESALLNSTSFLLQCNQLNMFAVSKWVSPKRTRSYPYARIYDTLNFGGKKVTIIPIIKDEGLDGDRDFLQWDTISLMSLLDVYIILTYYITADAVGGQENKITSQGYNVNVIKQSIDNLIEYKSSALHWNLSQITNLYGLAKGALDTYDILSKILGVEVHSRVTAERHIEELFKTKDVFINKSRDLSKIAQKREVITTQPKEFLKGNKAAITITNYLGGCYHFTIDEYKIENENLWLIESKHSRDKNIPSKQDIKDGLLKMFLFVNLEDIRSESNVYKKKPALALTSRVANTIKDLNKKDRIFLDQLLKEAELNSFNIIYNNEIL